MKKEERRKLFSDVTELLELAQIIQSRLIESCPHEIFQHGDSVYCNICKKDFGWWCPDSPDHTCHYFSMDGMVELLDGTTIERPKGAIDPQYETEDQCLFCGQPEERK